MARLSERAARQITDLQDHYHSIERFEAADRLTDAVDAVLAQIDREPLFRRHPATHEELRSLGLRWVHVHRSWFGYVMAGGEARIDYVFYDRADIPRRLG